MHGNFHKLGSDVYGAVLARSADLLGAVASGHRQGVPMALAAGVTFDTFRHEPDLAAIWESLHVAADCGLDKPAAATLACKGLKSAGAWNPEGAISVTGSTWNIESVAMLFCSYPGPSAVPGIAAELVALVNDWHHLRRAARVFDAAVRRVHARMHPRHTESRNLRNVTMAGRAA